MIYLDNNATTRLSDEVLAIMMPYLRDEYGNASSIQHAMGRRAHRAIENARDQIARALSVESKEIYFTSGATEAINTVLKGVFERYAVKGKHIITTAAEHKAVLTVCEYLASKGAEITYVPLDNQGQIDMLELEQAIRPDTILVTVMAANNETGVISPIQQIADLCVKKDVLYFCDATQYVGKVVLDLSQLPIDMLCLSAHKFHGPKGVGALFVRRKRKPIQITPLIQGGKQEDGRRGGTYSVAQIVGLGQAFASCSEADVAFVQQLRDDFETRVNAEIPAVEIHGAQAPRLYNTSNICFKHVRAAELITQMPDIAVSSGAACVSGDRDPSHVLRAMHIADEDALCSLRFSFSKYNSSREVEQVVEQLTYAVQKIREASPIWQMYKAGILD